MDFTSSKITWLQIFWLCKRRIVLIETNVAISLGNFNVDNKIRMWIRYKADFPNINRIFYTCFHGNNDKLFTIQIFVFGIVLTLIP